MAERSLNKVMLIGRLGRDPEVRYTSNGKAVASFSVATSEQWKDQSGADQERTEWHKIVAFGRLGEICGEFLNKGRQVYIEGRIQSRDWEDKDGNKRTSTEIIAADMVMLGGKGSSRQDFHDEDEYRSGEGGRGSRQGRSSSRSQQRDYEQPPPEDKIPF